MPRATRHCQDDNRRGQHEHVEFGAFAAPPQAADRGGARASAEPKPEPELEPDREAEPPSVPDVVEDDVDDRRPSV